MLCSPTDSHGRGKDERHRLVGSSGPVKHDPSDISRRWDGRVEVGCQQACEVGFLNCLFSDRALIAEGNVDVGAGGFLLVLMVGLMDTGVGSLVGWSGLLVDYWCNG